MSRHGLQKAKIKMNVKEKVVSTQSSFIKQILLERVRFTPEGKKRLLASDSICITS